MLGCKYKFCESSFITIKVSKYMTSDAVRRADSGVNIGDSAALDGMANLRCFPRDFCWIRERDLLGEGDASDAAITEALLLPDFLEMLPAFDDLRDLTFQSRKYIQGQVGMGKDTAHARENS